VEVDDLDVWHDGRGDLAGGVFEAAEPDGQS
jgi:hypothetical protein